METIKNKVIVWGIDNFNTLALMRAIGEGDLDLFFLIKGVISVIVSLLIFFVSSFKTESYEVLKEYVKKVMAISSGKEIMRP